jgi:hypothetical protein
MVTLAQSSPGDRPALAHQSKTTTVVLVEPSLACRDRIPGKVSRWQGASSVLQEHSGRFMSWRVALMWGTVIVAVVLGVLAAAYLLIQTFVFG